MGEGSKPSSEAKISMAPEGHENLELAYLPTKKFEQANLCHCKETQARPEELSNMSKTDA